MNNDEIRLGRYVVFWLEGRKVIGKLVSVEKGVANIKGIEQEKYERPAYHPLLQEIREATQDDGLVPSKNEI